MTVKSWHIPSIKTSEGSGQGNVLLVNMEGNANDSSLNHSEIHTPTNNNVTFSDVDGIQDQYGIFNGSSSYISYPDSADWDFGAGDFTVGAWVYTTLIDDNQPIVSQFNVAVDNSDRSFAFFVSDSGTLQVFILDVSGTLTVNYSAGSININTWTYVAMERFGSTLYLYIAGQVVGNVNVTGLIIKNSTDDLRIGYFPWFSGTYFIGRIDMVRIDKGVALYEGQNFTPPL